MKVTHTVIYDGDCKVCGRMVKLLTKWDQNHDLEIIPSQTPGVRERFPWISPRAYVDSIQVIRATDGRTWQAAAAVEELVNVLPKGRFISWVFRIPFMRPLADRFYRWFARNRYRLGCGKHCTVRNLAVLFCVCFSSLTAFGCASEPGSQSPAVAAQSAATVRDSFAVERDAMVDQQIRERGIKAPAVLKAMRKVPRHRFVPAPVRHMAYEDHPLPIGSQQTISQPFIVAYMTEAADITPNETVLEIGTGSGYQAAILGEVAREVYTIEIIPELAESARITLAELGYANVHAKTGNGYLGWPEHAPFDAILVTAAPDQVPQALVDQLAIGGKMVVPVGQSVQNMMIIERTLTGVVERRTIDVRFVPMTGKPTR